MTTPTEAKRDIRRFRMVSLSPSVVEPANRRLMFDPATFRGLEPASPLLADHVNATSRVAGRILSAWADRKSNAILGDVEIYPDDIAAAASVRRLLNAGHRGASIRHTGMVERNADGTNAVRNWGIAHLAIVGEGADPTAGPIDLADSSEDAAYFELAILPQEDDMPDLTLEHLLAAADRIGDRLAERLAAPNGAAAKPDDAEAIGKMLTIAGQQAELGIYDSAGVATLALDHAQGKIASADDFRAKLESIQINPKPIAPGISDAEETRYDLDRAIQGIADGDLSQCPIEEARSRHLLKNATVPHAQNAGSAGLLIPLEVLRQHRVDVPESTMLATRSTTGAATTQTAEHGVVEELVEFYRGDIPDPANILPLMTRVPGTAGDPRFVKVTTPTPATVDEPGTIDDDGAPGDLRASVGYAETGDTTTSEVDFAPLLLVCYTAMTRYTNVRVPGLSPVATSILLDKMDEVRNEQIIEAMMAATDTTRNLDDMTKSAEITAAMTTPEAIRAAVRQSFKYENVPGANRVIVARPQTVDEWLNIAEPAAVGKLIMEDGNGRMTAGGVPIIKTGHGERRQGFCGPMALTRLKEWDDAAYVSGRYQAGNQYLLVEMFWNWTLLPDPHASEFYVWLDAA